MDNFIDYVKIMFRSGDGGAGKVHLRSESMTPKGGPDGGNGGRGGHIILKGNRNEWTLLSLKYHKHITADNGRTGGANNSTGADGEDIIVQVPLGTVARDAETGEFMLEITEPDEQKILMKGGRGGKGNAHFRTATRQTPRYAQPGEPGLEGWVILELKLLADVGLVGFPNAGKSTLLSVVSAAEPKIGDYPFTTLKPNLGLVEVRPGRSFVMADIPGIIEGAHEGKGLGHRFLRHIERNSVLLFMIPCDTDRTFTEEYEILLNELRQFNPDLLDKPRMLVITKSDMVDEDYEKLLEPSLPKDLPTMFISSVSQKNIQKLKDALYVMLNESSIH